MPAAIPLAIAGATMVANNVAQKAAIKNNENQQAAAVGNAQHAADQAFQRQSQWLQGNPSPYGMGTTIARPPGFAPTSTINGINPQQIMQRAFPNGTPSAPWSDFQHALLGFAQHAGGGATGSFQPANGEQFHPGAFGSLSQLMGGMLNGHPAPPGMAQRLMQGPSPQSPPMVNTQPMLAPYGVNH